MIDASGKANLSALPAAEQRAIDRLCEEFELALQAGGSAAIEPYLPQVGPELRGVLLEQLLALELAYLASRGSRIEVAEYAARFPDQRAEVERAAARFEAARTDTASLADQSTGSRASRGGSQLAVGTRIGKFEVLEHLGHGGFGDVYRCRDTQLQREVALKLPRAGTLATREDIDRFLREARAAAQLSHAHIVPVYEAGEIEGRPFIASKFIAGRSLRKSIAEGKPWGAEGSARLVFDLASALHYAHLRGVFHRDVKPENVMLDDAGRPFLMDFGLARRLEGETLRTEEGLQLGTPAYMSPEQAEGRSHLADARSDQWALGVIFYELLVGRRPFRGTLHQVLAAIAGDDPQPPRSLVATVPLDLETILLKCLEKNPEQRYPSCQHVAEEIERWRRGDAIEARPASWWESTERQVRRHPVAVGIALLTLLALVVGVVYWQTRPAYLDLRVTPATARVKLGDTVVPLADGRAVLPFAPGRHILSATAEEYIPAEREVLLVRGSENTNVVQVDLRSAFGYLRANSEPPGASVNVVDAAGRSVALGTTPFHSPRLRAGSYTLTLSKPLFVDAQTTAEAPDGERVGEEALLTLKPTVTGASSYDRLLAEIQAMDRPLRGKWEFVETPLVDATQLISRQEGITITIDRKSLEEIGISLDSPVTYESSQGSLRENLRELLEPLEVTFHPRLREGGLRIEILTPENAESRRQTVVFPVDGIPSADEGDFDSLIEQITSSIVPDSWEDVGGPGSVNAVASPPSLVISQTWDIHVQVQKYLTEIRNKAREPGAVKPRPAARAAPAGVLPQPQSPVQLPGSVGIPATLQLVRDDPFETPEQQAWAAEVDGNTSRDPHEPAVAALRARGLALRQSQAGTAAAADTAEKLAQLPWPLDALPELAIPAAGKAPSDGSAALRAVAGWPPASAEAMLCLALSPNQRWVATGHPTQVQLREFPSLAVKRSIPCQDRVVGLEFSDDARTLTISPGRWGRVGRIELPDGALQQLSLPGADRPTAFSPDGRRWAKVVAAGSAAPQTATTIVVGTGDAPARPLHSDWMIGSCQFCPDGGHLALVAGPMAGGLVFFELDNFRRVADFRGTTSFALSPRGDWLATFTLAASSGTNPKPPAARPGGFGGEGAGGFGFTVPRPELVVRSTEDLRAPALPLLLDGRDMSGLLAASPDGRRLAFLGGTSRELRVWDIEVTPFDTDPLPPLARIPLLPAHVEWANARLEFTTDGRHLLVHTGIQVIVYRIVPAEPK